MNKNEKTKSKSGARRLRVTAVDLIILAALVIAALLIYDLVFGGSDFGEDGTPVSYVVKASGIRDELSDRIAVGDSVYMLDGGAYMGKVTAFERRSAVTAATGKTIQGKSDIYVTIEADAAEYEDGGVSAGVVLLSGHAVHVEGALSLRTDSFSFEGVCISIGK